VVVGVVVAVDVGVVVAVDVAVVVSVVVVSVVVGVDVIVVVAGHVWHMRRHRRWTRSARVPSPSQEAGPNLAQNGGSTMPSLSQFGFSVIVAVEVAVVLKMHGPPSLAMQSEGPKQGRPALTG
jgi:hypothetical protein